MYVCMYVRMYVCMYACIYVSMYVCMYVRMYVCTYFDMRGRCKLYGTANFVAVLALMNPLCIAVMALFRPSAVVVVVKDRMRKLKETVINASYFWPPFASLAVSAQVTVLHALGSSARHFVFAGAPPQRVCTSGWGFRPAASMLLYSAFCHALCALFAVAPPRCNCQNSSACAPHSTRSVIALRASVLATMSSLCSSITFTAANTAG